MAVKKVRILMGQSNADGQADKASLSASLRGPQANSYIFNYENNAIEVLNCDAVGANQPNNVTSHIAGWCGPEMTLSASVVVAEGECYLFKYAVSTTSLGPSILYREWHPEANDLYTEFTTRFGAFVAKMATLGHTVDVCEIYWYQGEADTFIEGNDNAYLGLFKRFKSDVRAFLAPYTSSPVIKWTSALIHQPILPSGPTIFLLNRTKNVRAALLKAGWDDKFYRIVDADKFSFQTNLIHLDTQGVMDCGNAFYAAAQLTTSNTMALEDYTLASIRQRMSEEFGIELNNENMSRIDNRINDALAWIVNRRKNWPWLHRDAAINIGEKSTSATDIRYGASIFSLAQTQGLYSSWSQSPVEPRELLDFTGDGYAGLMALSYTGTTIQLRQGFADDDYTCAISAISVGAVTTFTVNLTTARGGTAVLPTNVSTFGVKIAGTSHATPAGSYDGYYYATRTGNNTFTIAVNSAGHTAVTFGTVQIAREFTVAQGYLELPEDYIRNDTAYTNEDDGTPLTYRHPTIFNRELRQNRVASNSDRIYTVVPDPMNVSNKKFIAVYPFFTERCVLNISYFTDVKKLIADDDVPDVPRSDRFVVINAAGWFVAQWQKDTELLAFYRDGALNELERMAKEYQLSDDLTENLPSDAGRTDNEPIRGPSGFPEFDLP